MKNPFKNYDVVRCSACGGEIHTHVDRYRRVTAGRSEYFYHLPQCPSNNSEAAEEMDETFDNKVPYG